jgi:integrase
MPYNLVPPKAGRSTFWRVRGTEYGIELDRSTKVADKASAAKLLKQWRDEAKRQHLAPPDEARGLTFAGAAVSYLRAGRSKLFVKPLVLHFGETLLSKIGQTELDAAAAAILPDALPQTRNRAVYTPALAIMRHAGVVKAIKRPKWTGGRRLDWLRPDDAFKLLEGASVTDTRLGALMTFLLYAGPRLSEALRLTWADVDLTAATALLRETKNGESIVVHLPPEAVAALANLDKTKRRVFGLTKCALASSSRPVARSTRCDILTPCGGVYSPAPTQPALWRRACGSRATRRACTSIWT